jgi:hypothetical protein
MITSTPEIPKRYCTWHGLPMKAVITSTNYDFETGIPIGAYVEYVCPDRLTHFFMYDGRVQHYVGFNYKKKEEPKYLWDDNCHSGGK